MRLSRTECFADDIHSHRGLNRENECPAENYYCQVMSNYPQFPSELTDIPQPAEKETPENEATAFNSRSRIIAHHRAEDLKNVLPLPCGRNIK
jgi:hypothetical protein